jgi:hypothetical protein
MQIENIDQVPDIFGIATSKSIARLLYTDPNNFGQVFYTWVQMINAYRKKEPKKIVSIRQTELSAQELYLAAECYLTETSQLEVYCLCFATANLLTQELRRFEEDAEKCPYPSWSKDDSQN